MKRKINMKRKILFLILSMTLLGTAVASAQSFESGNFKFRISYGEAEVTGLTSSASSLTTITIPGFVTYNGTVYQTRIGSMAFDSNTTLQRVYVNYGCTRVGQQAFANCTALTNVTLLGGGVLGNNSIRNVKSGAILRFLGEAPSSVLTNAITAFSGNYPQIHVSRVRNLAGWTVARDDLAFTPLASVAAADEAKLGDSPPRRTLGLITGLDTANGIRAWLVDADTRKQTIISVR